MILYLPMSGHMGRKKVELMDTTTTRARAPSDWLIGELFSCTE
jgi:hypothetical protein